MKQTIEISGMHCPSCKALIEDICSDYKEITSANVDVKKGKLDIEYEEGLDEKALVEEIVSSGPYKIK